MDSTTLTNLWWKKDKNGIEFLPAKLSAVLKMSVTKANVQVVSSWKLTTWKALDQNHTARVPKPSRPT